MATSNVGMRSPAQACVAVTNALASSVRMPVFKPMQTETMLRAYLDLLQ